jgi:hypothetical protein
VVKNTEENCEQQVVSFNVKNMTSSENLSVYIQLNCCKFTVLTSLSSLLLRDSSSSSLLSDDDRDLFFESTQKKDKKPCGYFTI